MQVSGFTPRGKTIDPIEVINAVSVDDYTSIREIAQKIGAYPSTENLEAILAICRSHEMTHSQAGHLSSIKPNSKATYPYFRWA